MKFLIPTFVDIIDVIIVTAIIYYIIITLNPKIRKLILFAFVIMLFIDYIASFFRFALLASFMDLIRNYWMLIILIILQKEIKQFFIEFFSGKKFFQSKELKEKTLNVQVIESIKLLTQSKTGALIVFEGKDKLDEIMEKKGILIDSLISIHLITSIFNTATSLHDGAIIIRNNRIHAAKAILPLTEKSVYNKRYGTRHLAAIGITEMTDAFAIVISEENSAISITKNGEISHNIQVQELEQRIAARE